LKVGGVIYATNSQIFNIDEIPKGVVTQGIVTTSKLIVNSNLTINDDLDLSFINMISLPKGLKVNGNLFLGDSSIKSLPEGLQVGGNLNIRNTPLAKRSNQYLLKMIGSTGNIKGSINR
jgi:hypothetical protein